MKNRKLSITILSLILIAVFMFPSTALAQGITTDDTVKKGETLDHPLVLVGQEVVMDGVINGDLLAIGNNISINGEVNGSLVAIGKNVSLNGPVAGSTYVSAVDLNLGPLTNIARDVYFIGANLVSQEGSTINRDLKAVSLEADLSGALGGKVDALIGPLKLVQTIYQFMLDQGWLSQPLKFDIPWFKGGYDNKAVPSLAFGLQSVHNWVPASYSLTNDTTSGAGLDVRSAQQAATIDVERLKSWAVPLLRNLAGLLILGLLVLWLLPAQLSYSGEQVRLKPWRMLLTGLLVFVFGWLVGILALLLILALAFFFYWVSLPNLGFLTGTIGLSSLGIALSIFWLSIVFFSKIIVAYLCGSLFFKRFLPKYAQRRVWPFLTGVILYALLASIPYLGWFIAVIATFLGLGGLWKLATTRKASKDLADIEEGPVLEDQNSAEPEPVGEAQVAEPAQDASTVTEA